MSETITDFLLARIAEDEEYGRAQQGYTNYFIKELGDRLIAECTAKRAIIKQHEAWPVLVEQGRPEFRTSVDSTESIAFHVSQNIAWLTEREYVKRFGEEPPTAPMIQTLAAIYSDHPDYRQEWAPNGTR